MPRIRLLAFTLPALLLAPGAAFAHAHLKSAEPAVDSTIATTPPQVVLAFTEGVEPRFSTIEVQDAHGQRVDAADPHTAPNDATHLIVSLKATSAGIYTVVWHATAVDTHKTEGNFRFTIGPANAASGGVAVQNAWSRATPPNAASAGAFVTLNAEGAPDTLTGASTPVAALAELHRTTNVDGVMQMRPVPMLDLEAGKPVTLAPGGYHIMMTGLRQALKQGDHFPLTLTFAHAAPVTVDVTVAGLGASTPPAGHDGMSMGGATK